MKATSILFNRITFISGMAIFSMFFGAGNVVFPLLLGAQVHDQISIALIGLMITAIGFPLLGLFGALLFKGNCRVFFSRIGKYPGLLLVLFAIALLGPFAVLPRCFMVAYAAVHPYFPNLGILTFSIFAGTLALILIFKRQRVLSILGMLLSPLLIVSLLLIIFQGLQGSHEFQSSALSGVDAFQLGLSTGYDTMDLLAAILFSATIWHLIQVALDEKKGQHLKPALIPMTLCASLIGGLLLGGIYLGLSYVSARHGAALSHVAPESILTTLAIYVLGPKLACVANFAIALACLTTVMALTITIVEVLEQEVGLLFGPQNIQINYKLSVLAILMLTVLFANIGFARLMHVIHPILSFCYPAIIVITICNILHKQFGVKSIKIPFYSTLLLTAGLKLM